MLIINPLLPYSVTVSKPSPAVQRLLKKRQKEHAAIIEDLECKLENINMDTDSQIRFKAELLKERLNQFTIQAQKVLLNFDVNHNWVS